jgi:hypothetical protein
LQRDGFPAAFGDFIYNFVRIGLGRSLVNDYARAFGRELLGNARADSFRRSRHYCNFSV